jgi:hypothetical protein
LTPLGSISCGLPSGGNQEGHAHALIVWRLLHRSGLAWFFGVTISSVYVLSLILAGMPWETTLAVTGLLTLTQVALLCTPLSSRTSGGGTDSRIALARTRRAFETLTGGTGGAPHALRRHTRPT